MRDLKEYATRCIADMESMGLHPTVKPSGFKVNNRAKRRWGQHNYSKHEIQINGVLLDEQYSDDGLRNTIYHELIHSLDDCHDELIRTGKHHGETWNRHAREVSKHTGLKIQRCSSDYEKLGVARKDDRKMFKMVCDCGTVFSKKGYRSPRWYSNPSRFKCTCCGSQLRLDMRV